MGAHRLPRRPDQLALGGEGKGELRIDPEADAAITYLAEHGVNVVLALGFGNRLYTQADPRRKLPQLWEWYYEMPAPPTTEEALRAGTAT